MPEPPSVAFAAVSQDGEEQGKASGEMPRKKKNKKKKSGSTSNPSSRPGVPAARRGSLSSSDADSDVPGLPRSAVSTSAAAGPGGSDSDSDDDEPLRLVPTAEVGKLGRRELMRMAFAGDDAVAEEFQREKAAAVEMDAPKEVDLTLPGWNAWAGSGLQPRKNVVVEKRKGLEAKKRKDKKLKNVIINEALIKKTKKYLVETVPFGYQRRDQYEQSLLLPLGREWNATTSHHKLIAPKVVTKMGRIIDPPELPKQNV
ncbi:hypothetical protein HK405_014378 [Cladochytrium tenue]|nr:hypothetical protein HK405_014378 [Cladochytrium tenue]